MTANWSSADLEEHEWYVLKVNDKDLNFWSR